MPPRTKIFVGKLPPTISEPELQALFERHGDVTECSVLGNYAFVHMKTEEEARTAINKLNNYEINGYRISVEVSKSNYWMFLINKNNLCHTNSQIRFINPLTAVELYM